MVAITGTLEGFATAAGVVEHAMATPNMGALTVTKAVSSSSIAAHCAWYDVKCLIGHGAVDAGMVLFGLLLMIGGLMFAVWDTGGKTVAVKAVEKIRGQ